MRADPLRGESTSSYVDRADVDRRLERLGAEWGAFPVDRRDETWPAGGFPEPFAEHWDGGRTGAWS